MAKEPAKDAAGAKPAEAPKGKEAEATAPAKGGGGGFKVAILLAVVMLVEAVTLVIVVKMFGGDPKPAHAKAVEPAAEGGEANEAAAKEGGKESAKEGDGKNDESIKFVELLVAKDQFPNQRTGRTYLYDTEIYITVKKKESDKLKKQVEAMQATLATDIAVVFRRAEPAQLLEPTLATLTRQIKAAMDQRLGKDADGQPVVHEVLIRKCIQFRTDS